MMPRATPYIHHERSIGDVLLKGSDLIWVMAGFYFATWYPAVAVDNRYWLAMCVAVIVVHLVGEVVGLYRGWRGVALSRELAAVLTTFFYGFFILLVLGVLTRYTDVLPRSALVIAFFTMVALYSASRFAVRFVQRSRRSRGASQRSMAIVGVNELAFRLARNLEDTPEFGLKLIGFFDDRPVSRTGGLPDDVGERLGSIDDLVAQARNGEVHRIYVTLPLRAEKRIRDVLNRLADTTASVYIVPDFFVFELLHSRWTAINGLPVVSVFENPFYGVDGLLKRVCDMLLASFFLVLLAVPMALIAAAVKWTSPGPIFFRQKRYGLDGREIRVWKFRSMRVCENDQVRQASRHDPRVTPLGALLRRTSLDELPQLFNVLVGEMSLVGPRPHATAHNEQYRRLIPGYMLRHKVKPGITGLAQVLGFRGETESVDKMAQRIQCDLQYIREWSLWMDIKILFRTIRVVLSGENAY